MIKKILSIFGVSVLLAFTLVIPVLAESNSSTKAMFKKEAAICMKTATTKKNVANKAAQKAYNVAMAKAKADYKNALKVVKDTFNSENKICKNEKEKTVVVELKAQNDSGITGKVTLKQENGKVKVSMMATGTPTGVSEPAHIHTGSCANLGGVKYPLTSVMNGKSETTLDATFAQLAAGLPLAINIHKSTIEAGVYVSCGDLKL